jgi:FkbM family methyltransferase
MIKRVVQTLAKRCLRGVGLEVQWYRGANTEDAILTNMLGTLKPAAVLDVGANIGQYAMGLRKLGYRGTIVSFEAIPGVHARLQENAARDRRWIVAPCAALGREDGEVEINIAANLVSSSILPMHATHLEAAPESAYVGRDRVRMARLDELAPSLVPPDGDLMLKIDTQGYEREVLEGATGLLGRIVALQLELSLVRLYDNAPALGEMVTFVERLGFEMFNIAPGFKNARTGRLLQADGFFVRRRGNG